MPNVDIFAQMAEPLSDGTWVNSRIARLVEIIQDYDPMLEVRWIPRDKRSPEDDVFQIVDTRINRVAFSVKDEASFDESVLTRIMTADISKAKNRPLTLMEEIEAKNAAVKLLQYKERMEETEERNEKVETILRSPLNAYKHDGYRFDLPPQDQPKKTIFVPSKRL